MKRIENSKHPQVQFCGDFFLKAKGNSCFAHFRVADDGTISVRAVTGAASGIRNFDISPVGARKIWADLVKQGWKRCYPVGAEKLSLIKQLDYETRTC